jgi:hypothetical protein
MGRGFIVPYGRRTPFFESPGSGEMLNFMPFISSSLEN